MTEIIGVRFKNLGKVYYFDPDKKAYEKGSFAIVETARGIECGEVAVANRNVDDTEIISPLKKVIRQADDKDLKQVKDNAQKEEKAFSVCLEYIEKLKLDMKLINVEYTFDNNKILFYFTADGRIDFRDLVKDLASVFKTRIELRQIGVRDEAKMLGGLGICGRPLCCSAFLGEFQPVSIKMAKEQGLSLNPGKISGNCGRLMCCLKYEQDVYEELMAITPMPGALVDTPDGKGLVIDSYLIKGMVKVSLDSKPDAAAIVYPLKDIKVLKNVKVVLAPEEVKSLSGLEKNI